MSKLPTDRYVLERIYEMYKATYPGDKSQAGKGANDPYVAIDIPAIARDVGCDPELLFGRLYYHLEQRYGYAQEGGGRVSLFTLPVGDKRHAIQFPYLVSILAGLNQDHNRQLVTVSLSFFAVGISLASLAVNLLKH